MIQILEEPVEVSGLLQLCLALVQHRVEILPLLPELGSAVHDDLGLLGVGVADLVGLFLEGLKLGLWNDKKQ